MRSRRYSALVLGMSLSAAAVLAAPTPGVSDVGRERPGRATPVMPLLFEVNAGQTDPAVRYLSRGDGYTLFLTATEGVLTLAGSGADPRSAVVHIRPLGADPYAPIDGERPAAARVNVLRGTDRSAWRTGIETYAAVRYRGVYPGVDLVYRGDGGVLEYDFIVAPGADARRIALTFDGGGAPEVDGRGDLILRTPAGVVRQPRPVAYQDLGAIRRIVPASYALEGSVVRFALGAYDPGVPLVIDPAVIYSTYLGNGGAEWAYAVQTDGTGAAFVAGATPSLHFPSRGGFQPEIAGGTDGWVAKLSRGGALEWATFLGGSDEDYVRDLALDASGHLVLAGATISFDFPVAGAIQPGLAGSWDAFVARLSVDGSTLMYATYIGGTGDEGGPQVAVSPAGKMFLGGQTCSDDFPTASAVQPSAAGECDAFVSVLDPSGASFEYSTYLGGTGTEQDCCGIAVDASGAALLGGMTNSTDFPTRNALQPENGGEGDSFRLRDGFLAKLAPGGSALEYSTYLGGDREDTVFDVAVDGSGAAYVTGGTFSSDFPTVAAIQPAFGDARDAFVAKIAPDGSTLAYSTYLGGEAFDVGYGIALDADGAAYVTGSTGSDGFPVKDALLEAGNGNDDDAFLSVLDPTGAAFVYSTYLGGQQTDYGVGIAVDATRNAYVAGGTQSRDFPTVNPYQRTQGGDEDAFVTAISAEGTQRLCREDGVGHLAGTPARGLVSGSIHNRWEGDLEGISPAAGELMHAMNCGVVVPVEDALDEVELP